MAAPTPTARSTPGGLKLKDGFSSMLTFAADSDIMLFEKSVQPPSLDGGEPVDTTTMHNTLYRTVAPRKLITLGSHTIKCAYDPKVYDQIIDIINDETTITVEFSDGSTLAYYGYLQKFEPEAMEEGTMPMANVTIVPTNIDASDVEAGPVMNEVSGT